MKQLIRYLIWFLPLFAGFNLQAQNNTVYGAGISYTNGVPSWAPNPRTSRAAVDTVTGRWYHFNTPGGWQWIGNTVEEISGCAAPAYTPDKGDSRLVINNCAKPEVYWYDGTVWKWINQGEVYTAGQGIRIESNTIILDSLYVLRFRTGSNTDGAAGTMSWNATEETLDLVTDQGAVTGHLMESAYYNTRNTTGTPITIGTVVMANGTTGNTGRILIAPAIANGTVNSEYILGLAAQTIGNNSNGKVQHFGKVRGIQTNGANYGETWVDGDVLYCSAVTPGYLTKVLPTAPSLKVPIAIVIHAHPSNGTLFVRPSHFPDLAQINDVQLSSPTNGQVLTYNSTLSRWENATPANQLQTLSTDNTPGNISISSGNTITLNVNDADASATNELQTLSTGTNTLTLSNGGGTVTVDTDPTNDVTGSSVSGRVSFWNGTQTQGGSSALTWDNVNSRLAIGLTTPISQIDMSGTITVRGGSTQIYSTTAGQTDRRLVFNSINPNLMTVYNIDDGDGNFYPIQIGSNTINNGITVSGNTGNTGIGTSAPAARLHVVGSGTSSTTWTAQFHNSAGNNNALMIRDDGKVGIGTNAPEQKLHIVGSAIHTNTVFRVTNTASSTYLGLYDALSPNMIAGQESYLAFGRNPTQANRALISFRYVGDASLSNHMTFGFNSIDYIFNITASRQVGVNTTSPDASAALDVTSTTRGVLFPRMTTTQRNAITTPADGLVIYNTTDNKLQVRAGGAWVDLH